MSDLEYLEQAEAHSDEGPLGEPASRAILKIALQLARENIALREALRKARGYVEDTARGLDISDCTTIAKADLAEIDAALNQGGG